MVPDRRQFLGATAAAIGAAVAGCVEQIETLAPGDSGPGYADWLYDPGELMTTANHGFLAFDVSAYRENRAALPPALRENVERPSEQYDGASIEDVERVVLQAAFDEGDPRNYRDDRFAVSAVATGSFDADAIREDVSAREGFADRGTYADHDVYGRTTEHDASRSQAFGVGAGSVLGAVVDHGGPEDGTADGGGPDATPAGPDGGATATLAVEHHLDAEGGDVERYAAAVPLVESVLAELGDRPLAGGATLNVAALREELADQEGELPARTRDLLDGLRGVGAGVEPGGVSTSPGDDGNATDGGTTTPASVTVDVEVRLYYDTEEAAEPEKVRDLLEAARRESRLVEETLRGADVAVEVDGATVVASASLDPREAFRMLGFGGGGSSGEEDRSAANDRSDQRAPRTAFSFEHRSDGRVRITHDGGDNVDSANLTVRYRASDGTATERWDEPDGEVSAGDRYTTERAIVPGGTLRVVWESDDGGAAATLGKFVAPE